MDMTMTAVFTFAGGVALFLLGMRQMTDGLKVAAGGTLRAILVSATRSRVRGLLSGVLITTMVQSSSAVIFATVGFVNAGLITLSQAIGVIYGSNLGTTLTSWIVALVGFNVNLKALAMPCLALGMALWVGFGSRRRGALGQALAGFGLFFLGLDVLQETFAGPSDVTPFEAWADRGVISTVIFMLIGMGLTVLMQSSSAALAVTLTAAGTGVITLETSAAMVIGANVGTTSTALFAILGATAAAKRAALAHVTFNLVTAVASLLMLPLLIALAQYLVTLVGLTMQPATVLAVFHTQTKLLGIALMWPATGLMVRQLEKCFQHRAQDADQPAYLDKNVQGTPALAVDAMGMELRGMRTTALNATRDVLNNEADDGAALRGTQEQLERLNIAIGEFASGIHRQDSDRWLSVVLPHGVRVSQYYVNIAEQAKDYRRASGLAEIEQSPVAEDLYPLISEALAFLTTTETDQPPVEPEELAAKLASFESHYQTVKARLLRAGTVREISAKRMAHGIEQLSALHRIVNQAGKAASYLHAFEVSPADEADDLQSIDVSAPGS